MALRAFLEPVGRLVCARLQQMDGPDL